MNTLTLRSIAAAMLALAGASLAQTAVVTSEVPAIYFESAPFVPADNMGTPVAGSWSSLRRSDGGVTVSILTSDLLPGAYTVWWIVFNHPEFCSDGVCGEDDIFAAPFRPIVNDDGTFGAPGVVPQVLWAGGGVVGENGIGHFGGGLNEGDNSGSLFPGPGLIDASKAEIHNIIRYHGPVVVDHMPAQIQSVDGGCDVLRDGTPAEGGGFTCVDLQAVVHPMP